MIFAFHGISTFRFYVILFHHLTRTAYLYNGCLLWYNVVLTSRVHSRVKVLERGASANFSKNLTLILRTKTGGSLQTKQEGISTRFFRCYTPN